LNAIQRQLGSAWSLRAPVSVLDHIWGTSGDCWSSTQRAGFVFHC